MNASAVSPSDSQTLLHQRYLDFNNLQSALQTGNLSSAQGAFATFLQDVQQTVQLGGSSSLFSPGSQPAKDLHKLGNALKSSDLVGANQAFATLKQDLQSSLPVNGESGPQIHRPPANKTHALIAANGVESIAAGANPAASARAAGAMLNLQA